MDMSERLSIVAIGDEVLCGHTVNTDASTIALACTKMGRIPSCHSVVGDDPKEMEKVLRRELALGGDVIAFGGLGPTVDDCTREVVAKIFQCPLAVRMEYAHELEKRYGKKYPTIVNQSTQPKGAKLLPNSVGTAPGLVLEDQALFPGARLFVLPGPPQELTDVLMQGVLPLLKEGKKLPFLWMTLVGVLEQEADNCLRGLREKLPTLYTGIYPAYGAVSIHLVHEDRSSLEKAREAIAQEFGNALLPEETSSLEAYLVHLLREKGWTIASAESCTGGGLSARIASVEGASTVLLGSVVAYRDSVKERVLAVPQELIATHGVVSQEVTHCMAESVQMLMGSDVAVATSGYFGPTGGTRETPIGTVCATILLPGSTLSQTFLFHGTRHAICEQTIGTLLSFLITLVRALSERT